MRKILFGVEWALAAFVVFLAIEEEWLAAVGFALVLCCVWFAKGFIRDMR